MPRSFTSTTTPNSFAPTRRVLYLRLSTKETPPGACGAGRNRPAKGREGRARSDRGAARASGGSCHGVWGVKRQGGIAPASATTDDDETSRGDGARRGRGRRKIGTRSVGGGGGEPPPGARGCGVGGRPRARDRGGGRGAPRRRPRTSSFVSSGASPRRLGRRRPRPAARERRLLRIGRALRPHRRGTAARSDRGGVREARRSRARSRPGTELPRRALPSARTRACGAEPARACRGEGARGCAEPPGVVARCESLGSRRPVGASELAGVVGREKKKIEMSNRLGTRVGFAAGEPQKEKVHEWALCGTPSSLKKRAQNLISTPFRIKCRLPPWRASSLHSVRELSSLLATPRIEFPIARRSTRGRRARATPLPSRTRPVANVPPWASKTTVWTMTSPWPRSCRRLRRTGGLPPGPIAKTGSCRSSRPLARS